MRNKMSALEVRKLFLWIFVFLFAGGVFATSLAYMPTSQDTANLTDLQTRLTTLVVDDNINLWNFHDQLKNLETEYMADDRLSYMLSNLKEFMYGKLFTLKTTAKISSETDKQTFLDVYNTGFSVEVEDSLSSCTGWYNTLDDISFAYDFPTSLTMATWYRESTCAYYLPSNGDGPFQIVNENYGTGVITEKVFVKTVTDFLEFAKAKFVRYEWELSWSLSYTGFDLTGIYNFAALYNGWTKSWNVIIPNNPAYLFDGYGDDFSGATRYGIFPQFVKSLEWEIENKY